jgi:hypothetical protein
MAIRLQVDKIEIKDHGAGERPGDRPAEFPQATPVVAPELANAPTIEQELAKEDAAKAKK